MFRWMETRVLDHVREPRSPVGRGVPATEAVTKDLTLLRALRSEVPKILMWVMFINVEKFEMKTK